MINKTRIQDNLETFSFPRLYGSSDEKKSYNLAKNKIEELDLNSFTQEFSFSKFYSVYYPRMMFILIFSLIFMLYLNLGRGITVASLIIIIILFISVSIYARLTNYTNIGKTLHSQNLYTKLNFNGASTTSKNSKKDVFLLAHLDSKGQRFNIVQRVKNFFLWAGTLIIIIVIFILKNYFIPQYALLLYILGALPLAIHLFTVIIICLNTTNNKSHGALDDASGVVCVLELLNYYFSLNEDMRLKKINLWFVLTGAEEGGTQGARRFYRLMKEKEINNKHAIVLNFDSIGTVIDYVKFGIFIHKKDILKVFLKNAEKLGVDVQTRKVPFGVHTDGYYLAKRGYQGIEFGDWDSYQYIHSIYDTTDKVDASVLKKCCEIVINSLSEIDEID